MSGSSSSPALALTASSGGCDVALRTPGGVFLSGAAPTETADDMAVRIRACLDEHGVTTKQLQAIHLDRGPGSYTGLRSAVTFTRILHHFAQVPVMITDSLQMMALATWNAGDAAATQTVHPVLDARRQRFHHSRVAMSEQTRCVLAPEAVDEANLLQSIEDGDCIVADSALHDLLRAQTESDRCTLVEPSTYRADLLFDARLHLQEATDNDLEPLYLMASYAE